jgi:hypothetical protein
MRTETEVIEIYSATELNLHPELKEKVLEKYWDWNVSDNDWWECTYEDIEEQHDSKVSGFEIDKIYFSGFYSQGDGAMFEGRFLLNYTSELTTIADYVKDSRIVALIKAGRVVVVCDFEHKGHYYHEKSYINSFFVETHGNHFSDENIISYLDSGELEKSICDDYEDLCKSFYRRLEKSYDYLTTEESLMEAFTASDIEFTKDGKIFW